MAGDQSLEPTMRTPTPQVLLEARLRAVHARGRVSETLLGVALDAIEPYASDYLSAEEYRRVCELVSAPVEAASEAALAALREALLPALGEQDAAVATRVELARRRSL
jgi:hypothetical protein